MSQRWYTNDQYTVLVGFDRPLQGYFAVVWRRHQNPDTGAPVWSNLEESVSHPPTPEPWLHVLRKRFGITLPKDLLAELEKDGVREFGPVHPLADLFTPPDA